MSLEQKCKKSYCLKVQLVREINDLKCLVCLPVKLQIVSVRCWKKPLVFFSILHSQVSPMSTKQTCHIEPGGSCAVLWEYWSSRFFSLPHGPAPPRFLKALSQIPTLQSSSPWTGNSICGCCSKSFVMRTGVTLELATDVLAKKKINIYPDLPAISLTSPMALQIAQQHHANPPPMRPLLMSKAFNSYIALTCSGAGKFLIYPQASQETSVFSGTWIPGQMVIKYFSSDSQ